MIWRFGPGQFVFPRPAVVMGILNITPDSFSDGGHFLDPSAAVDRAHAMVAEGAELVDIGGESSRPGAESISEEEELRRVLPVVERLVSQLSVPLSIDTVKVGVAARALEAGARIVNDIGANRDRPELWEVVARHRAGYIAMHMQGTPATMQLEPRYRDVVAEVGDFFEDRLGRFMAAGIDREQVVLDPGIGFGKSLSQNLALISQLHSFRRWARPLLLGVSRKSFLGQLHGAGVNQRLAGGLACTGWAVQAGVQLFRTHDVTATVQFLRTWEALAAPQPSLS